MQKTLCILIEDEPLLANLLEDYISKLPFLELKHKFADALSAIDFIEQHTIDIVFIDINLPRFKGIDFIRMYPDKAKYIVISAYHEYAIEGYELNVCDYLLKPVSFNRFAQAVRKAVNTTKPVPVAAPDILNNDVRDYFYVSVDKKRVKVRFGDIVYIESLKEYIKIHFTNGKWLLTKLQIGQAEDLLNQEFVRIHRSYIVARNKVQSYNQSMVSMGQVTLPVGTNYKTELSQMLE